MNLQTQLPDGFTARSAVMSDLPAVIKLINAYSRHINDSDIIAERDLEPEWQREDYRPETHIRLVFDPQGQLAGYMEFWDVNRPCVVMHAWGRFDPAFSEPGIMAYLLEWAELRARQSMASLPENLRVVLRSPAPILGEKLQTELAQAGYQKVRRFWRMVIDLPSEPAAAQFPPGIEVRSMQPDELPRALHALRAAFSDHWGHVDVPFEEDFARWKHVLEHDPEYDPALFFFALQAGEIAGFSYCRRAIGADPGLGWVGQLGVLRDWRKQGLGLALLQHSFRALYGRGQRRVGLGVDASSLTGATRLYEKAGMRSDPNHIIDLYEKELRPGLDLSTQTIHA